VIYARDILKKAGKTTMQFLSWLEDSRYNHKIDSLKGIDAIITKRNGGSANEIYIHEDLEEKLNEFINQEK